MTKGIWSMNMSIYRNVCKAVVRFEWYRPVNDWRRRYEVYLSYTIYRYLYWFIFLGV